MEPEPALLRMDTDTFGFSTEIARMSRASWRVPTSPVADVTALVEAPGVFVARRDLGHRCDRVLRPRRRRPYAHR